MKRVIGLVLVIVGIVVAGGGLLVGALLATELLGRNPAQAAAPLFISFAVVAGGALMIFAGVRTMRGATPLGREAASVGRTGDYLLNVPEPRLLGERPYVVHYQPPVKGKNGRPSSLVVQVPGYAPVTLRFKKETWFDRLAKRWGIVRECHTEDAEFDDEVYVRGMSDGYIEQVLADADKRLAVRALLRHGMKEVRLTGTHVEAAWQGFDPAKDDRPDFCQEAAAGLFVVADRLPSEDPDYELNQSDPWSKWHALLWVFAISLAATFSMMFVYTPVHGDELFWAGMTLFAVVYPLFAVVAMMLLRGRSTSHDRLLVLLGGGLLLLAFGCVGAVATVNGLADNSRPHERKVTVLKKNTNRGRRGGRSYSVRVPAWDRPGKTIRFRVSASEYNRVAPGRSQMELTTREGALGIEWIEKQQVLP